MIRSSGGLHLKGTPKALDRVGADVAMDADGRTGILVGGKPLDVTGNGTTYTGDRIGGTSLSAPLLAGVQALAQQEAGHRLGFANPEIYQRYGTPPFHDITKYTLPDGGYPAEAAQPLAGASGVVRLPRTVPPKGATEMILTGRRISADEALTYGLVNRVVEAGTAVEGARTLAAEILDGSPTSVRISLQVMEEKRGIPDVIDAVTHPSTAFDELMTSEDFTEGLTAFAQKRRPHWRNR